eukprot:7246101-Lingulodinium_polyedra.AAC.1
MRPLQPRDSENPRFLATWWCTAQAGWRIWRKTRVDAGIEAKTAEQLPEPRLVDISVGKKTHDT